MRDMLRELLASLPREGAIVSVNKLAWAMHAELCDWKHHTTVCWDRWQKLAADILEVATRTEGLPRRWRPAGRIPVPDELGRGPRASVIERRRTSGASAP
jgi:hypothetical protein